MKMTPEEAAMPPPVSRISSFAFPLSAVLSAVVALTCAPAPAVHAQALGPAWTRNFAVPADYPLPASPADIALADVDHDGHLDVVVAWGSRLDVWVNDGAGKLSPGSGASVPGVIERIAFDRADLTSRMSLATTAGIVEMTLPSGGPTVLRTVSPGRSFTGAAYADADGDHVQDLMAADPTDCLLFVWFSVGTASEAPRTYRCPGGASEVATGDVDGDGRIDAIVGGDQSVTVLRFDAAREPITIARADFVALPLRVGDFDSDGRTDLLSPGAVQRSRGDGTFESIPIPNGYDARFVDLDHDGRTDVVSPGYGGIVAAYQLADGTFRTISVTNYDPLSHRRPGTMLAAGDLDGDGGVDFVFSDYINYYPPPQLRVILHGAACDFAGAAQFPIGFPAHDVTYDPPTGGLLVSGSSGVFFVRRTEDVSAWTAHQLSSTPSGRLWTVDLDLDGVEDLVTQDGRVALRRADGSFGSWASVADGRVFAIGRFTGNRLPDIVVVKDSILWVARNLGGGLFSSLVQAGILPHHVGTGPSTAIDVDGDGRDEIAYTTTSSYPYPEAFRDSLWLLRLTGHGNQVIDRVPLVGPAYSKHEPFTTTALKTANLNGDRRPDLVVVTSYGTGPGYAVPVLGSAGGRFTVASGTYLGRESPDNLAVADFDGDGRDDVVVTSNISGNNEEIQLVMNDGSGNLQSPQFYQVGLPIAYAVEAGDFNGDGRPDIAALSNNYYEGATVTIIYNRAPKARRSMMARASAASEASPARSDLPRLELIGSNPVSSSASLRYRVADTTPARIELFDVQGRRVLSRDLVTAPAGDGNVSLPVTGIPQGVYAVRLHQGARTVGMKLVIAR